jgi:hypothetical protein
MLSGKKYGEEWSKFEDFIQKYIKFYAKRHKVYLSLDKNTDVVFNGQERLSIILL